MAWAGGDSVLLGHGQISICMGKAKASSTDSTDAITIAMTPRTDLAARGLLSVDCFRAEDGFQKKIAFLLCLSERHVFDHVWRTPVPDDLV